MRRRPAFQLALLVASLAAAPARAETAVDLELVLAVDISRSMDPDEQQLQRQGYVDALTHPDLIAAITKGPHHRIALSYVEWAGPVVQITVVDWRVIDGADAAKAFADALAKAPIQSFRGTAISDGLTYAQALFDGNGITGARRVIDISGDGPNNIGLPVEPVRDAMVRAGITINGLPIMIKQAYGFASIDNLDQYYQDCVIGGAGAFTLVVRSADQFAEAIRRKLVLEIADRSPPPSLLLPATAAADGGVDCLIGEKLRQKYLQE